ncbi:MAG: outer membrane beta-barrel protein [Acidobacteriota bacterium]
MQRAAWMTLVVVVSSLFVRAEVAHADVREYTGELELFGGVLFTDDALLDGEGAVYGLRVGYNASDRWGFQAALGLHEDDGFSGKTPFDYEAWNLDLSAVYHVNPEDTAVFTVFGGVGASFIDVDPSAFEDDTFTAHFGLAGKFAVSEHAYLRLDARARWLEDSDHVDLETTFALGFRWGN